MPVYEAINELDGLFLITETPEVIAVSMGEELGANPVLYGFWGVFYLYVD